MIGSADKSQVRYLISGHSHQNRNCLEVSLDKSAGVIDRINPQAELLNRYIFFEVAIFWEAIKSYLFNIEFNMPFIILGLFSDDFERGEEMTYPPNQKGLYLKVSLL